MSRKLLIVAEACGSPSQLRLLNSRRFMGKYSFKGGRKAVEKFSTRQGLGILVAIGAFTSELATILERWVIEQPNCLQGSTLDVFNCVIKP